MKTLRFWTKFLFSDKLLAHRWSYPKTCHKGSFLALVKTPIYLQKTACKWSILNCWCFQIMFADRFRKYVRQTTWCHGSIVQPPIQYLHWQDKLFSCVAASITIPNIDFEVTSKEFLEPSIIFTAPFRGRFLGRSVFEPHRNSVNLQVCLNG